MAKLFFRYAAMNSGKSTLLLQIANNYESLDMRVALYTAGIDDRYGSGKITSRLDIQRDAQTFDAQLDFFTLPLQDIACLLLDEAQFLTPVQVTQLHRLAHLRNVPVICFGLRSDFQGQPFPGAAHLLTLAEDLEEIRTICLCGRKATMHLRVDATGRRIDDGPQIEIGNEARYRSVCAKCFYKAH